MRPACEWFAHNFVPSPGYGLVCPVLSSRARARRRNHQVPRVPLPDVGVTSIREPYHRLFRGHYSPFIAHTDSFADPGGSPLLRLLASLEESVQVATSPCCPQDLPDVILRIVPMMPEPLPRRSTECLCLVLPQCHWPSLIIDRSAFLMFRERDFPRVRFETAAISLCSGLTVCSPHRSLPPLQFPLQGGRDFYIRAKRASLPPHASDMLSAQLQAIDGTRTLTSPDSQPCRLLPIIAYAV